MSYIVQDWAVIWGNGMLLQFVELSLLILEEVEIYLIGFGIKSDSDY